MSTSTTFSVPPGYHTPFALITDSDHGGWIIIATSLGLVVALLSTAIRVYVKTVSQQNAGTDDFLLATGTVFALLQEIVILNACAKGLGRRVDLLDSSSLDRVEKSFYSNQILSVMVLGLCKCSVAFFILRLTPLKLLRRALFAIIGCTVAWTIAAVLAFALQCNLDRPWAFTLGHCRKIFGRILVVGILDIVLEIAIFGAAVLLVWPLHTSFQKKATVVLAFSLRLPIVGFIIARVLTAHVSVADFSLSESLYIIWTVTQVNYSLLSTTLPMLRLFIKDLATIYGTMTPSLYEEIRAQPRPKLYNLSRLKHKQFNASKGGVFLARGQTDAPQDDLRIIDFGAPATRGLDTTTHYETDVQGGTAKIIEDVNASNASERSIHSQRMIIHVETDIAVERKEV